MGTNANTAVSVLAPEATTASEPEISKANKNANLSAARSAKNDEFYTRLEDIQAEIKNYIPHFKGKTVFCNCDDPEWSNFWVFFRDNFDALKLQRLVATYYTRNGKSGGKLMCHDQHRSADGKVEVLRYPLQGDGDFRSPECVALLEEADIVCTNPPFSLFREYIALLMAKEKKFLVIGDMNAITYKETFPLIRGNQIWLGCTTPKQFRTDKDKEIYQKFGNKCWFTNLSHKKRNTPLELFRSIKDKDVQYDRYDNYDAINVSKTQDIPADYSGVMGVPISYLSKYNPKQFEIIGMSANGIVPDQMKLKHFKKHNEPYISGKKIYQRLFVRKRQSSGR